MQADETSSKPAEHDVHAPLAELQVPHDEEQGWHARYPGENVFSGQAVQFCPEGVSPEKQLVHDPELEIQLVQLEQG